MTLMPSTPRADGHSQPGPRRLNASPGPAPRALRQSGPYRATRAPSAARAALAATARSSPTMSAREGSAKRTSNAITSRAMPMLIISRAALFSTSLPTLFP